VDEDLVKKEVFTTSEVARLTHISKQKVVNLIDQGEIKAYKIPGKPGSKSQARRVPREALLDFMRKHGMPTAAFEDARKRVLIVDDDPASVELLSALFVGREGDFEIRTAANGSDAAVIAGSFHPHLILLDLMLPDLDGDEIFLSIRREDALKNTKVIVVSALTDPAKIEQMTRRGADAYITKPINIARLQEEIARALA